MQGLTGRLWEIWWDIFVIQFDGREICQVVCHKSEEFFSKLSNPVLKLWVSQNLVYCLFALLPLTLAVLVEGSTVSPPPPFPLLSKNWWLRYATSGCFFRRENSLPSIPDDITGGVGNSRFRLWKVCQPKYCNLVGRYQNKKGTKPRYTGIFFVTFRLIHIPFVWEPIFDKSRVNNFRPHTLCKVYILISQ